jgi:uncharacterized protein (UPF0276 family)
VSVHGDPASLGSPDGVEPPQRPGIARLVAEIAPVLVSEHLAWSRIDGTHLNDLLPLPLTEETLAIVADNVARIQDRLGRQLLVENPAGYVAFASSTLEEPDFLCALARRTGCGLLLDVNNLFVASHNLGFDAARYLARIPASAVREIHLAGHERSRGPHDLLIDTHARDVAPAVWSLYEAALRHLGARPTLIEWDVSLPTLARLLAEARRAETRLARVAAAS